MKLKKTIGAYLFPILLPGFFVPFLASAYEAAPRAQTSQPTFVTEKSMQLNGLVNPNEVNDTYQWFEWGIVGRSNVYETRRERVYGGNWQVNTNATISGLAPATQYFFRQIAENSRGKDVGQTGYVTTKPLSSAAMPIAVVMSQEATFVEEGSATLHGYVSPHGNNETKVWFEWGLSINLENQTPRQWFGGNSGPTEARLERLMPGTLYYFRAVAENSEGRSLGLIRVFVTRGTPPVAPPSELPREQYVPSPVDASSDNVSRSVTTEGATEKGETTPPPGFHASGLPVIKGPGDFFAALFGGRKQAQTSATDERAAPQEGDEEIQLAAAAASGAATDISGMFTGKRSVEVVVEKIGEKGAASHTPVEYRIAYAYRRDNAASGATLKIILPPDVIYIGDNTNNELLIESGTGPLRTYVLPLGKLEKGATRAVSILGMTTGAAVGIPDVIVRLEYTDAAGTHVVPAGEGTLTVAEAVEENVASVAGAKDALLPNSLLGWVIYVVTVVGVIFGIRKLKEYYVAKKEMLIRRDEETERLRAAQSFPGSEEMTPAVTA